jgi:SAM-dependent methyltransferase
LQTSGFVNRTGEAYAAAPGLAAFLRGPTRGPFASELRSTLLQGRDFYESGRRKKLLRGWQFTDPDLLEAQGTLSAMNTEVLVGKLVPTLAGLQERFTEGAKFLDIGSGVGSIMIEMCRRVKTLRCTGLEPAAAPMEIARKKVAASGFADRIELRAQLVQEMTDRDAFDLAWLPAAFFPDAVLTKAIACVRAGLRPGGWLVAFTLSSAGSDPRAALSRMLNVIWGGEPLTAELLQDRLAEGGLIQASILPVPALGTKLVVARKAD